MSESDIERDIERYLSLKEELSSLEKKVDKYKQRVEEYMEKNKKDKLMYDKYIVTRNLTKRSTISKKNVPSDIFNRYSTETSYYVYNFKKIK